MLVAKRAALRGSERFQGLHPVPCDVLHFKSPRPRWPVTDSVSAVIQVNDSAQWLGQS